MSAAEVISAVLALMPVVIEFLESWQLDMMTFQFGKRDETLHDCLVRSYVEQRVFEDTIVQILEEVSADPLSLNSLRDSEFWRDSKIDERLREKLGSTYDTFVDLCFIIHRELRRLMDQLSKFDKGSSTIKRRLLFMTSINTIQEELLRIGGKIQTLRRIAVMQSLHPTRGTYRRHADWRSVIRSARRQATAILTILSQTGSSSATHWDVAVFCQSVGVTRKSAKVRLLTHMQPTTGVTQPGGPKALSEPWWEIEGLTRSSSRGIWRGNRDLMTSSDQIDEGSFVKPSSSKTEVGGPGSPRTARAVRFAEQPPIVSSDEAIPAKPVTRPSFAVTEVIGAQNLANHLLGFGQHPDDLMPVRYNAFDAEGGILLHIWKPDLPHDARRATLEDVIQATNMVSFSSRLALCIILIEAVIVFSGVTNLNGRLDSRHIWFPVSSGTICAEDILLDITVADQLSETTEGLPSSSGFDQRAQIAILLLEILLFRKLERVDEDSDVAEDATRLGPAFRALEQADPLLPHSISAALRYLVSSKRPSPSSTPEDDLLEVLEQLCTVHDLFPSGPHAELALLINLDKHETRALALDVLQSFHLVLKQPGNIDRVILFCRRIVESCQKHPLLKEQVLEQVLEFIDMLQAWDSAKHSTGYSYLSLGAFQPEVVSTLDSLRTLCTLVISSSNTQDVRELQHQLRLRIVRLTDVLGRSIQLPSSPASIANILPSNMDEGYWSSLSKISRRIAEDQDNKMVQGLDARAVAIEIVSSLRSCTGLGSRMSSEIDVTSLKSGLREALLFYVEELRALRHSNAASWLQTQSELYQLAGNMLSLQLEFILKELVTNFKTTKVGKDASFPLDSGNPVSLHGRRNEAVGASSHIDRLMSSPSEQTERPTSSNTMEHNATTTELDTMSNPTRLLPLSVVEEHLLGGKPFGRLRLRFRRLLQQGILDIIRDEVLQGFDTVLQASCSARVHIRWGLETFVLQELGQMNDLRRALTITGDGTNAYAASCEQYVKWLWKNSTLDICHHVQEFLKEHFYESEDASLTVEKSSEGQNKVTFSVIGTTRTIVELCQQLAWLTASVRCVSEGVHLSDISFIATRGAEFYIEINPYTPTPETKSACWHRLVGTSAIAAGFPIPPRNEEAGLEIPLELMITLSRTSSFMAVGDKFAFVGFSSVLHPSRRTGSKNLDLEESLARPTLQWHFESNKSVHDDFDFSSYLAQESAEWTGENEENGMSPESRHFVGYCKDADIRLAKEDCEYNVQLSALPEDSSGAGVRIKSISSGFPGMGMLSATATLDILISKTTKARVEQSNYDDIVYVSKTSPVVIWDSAVQCGWLVPLNAVLLHMVHLYIKARNLSHTTLPHVPTGQPLAEEVDRILREQYKNVICTSLEDDQPLELRRLVKTFYMEMKCCMAARIEIMRENKGAITYTKGCVTGWELMDFIGRPPFDLEFVLKRDNHATSASGWQELAAEKNLLVMVCRNAGDIIRPSAPETLCEDWRLPPKHKQYLVASLACLKDMARQYGGFRSQTRLSSQLAWRPNVAAFEERCQHRRGRLCTKRLQHLFRSSDMGQTVPADEPNLPVKGAVVFGTARLQKDKAAVEVAGDESSPGGKPGKLKKITTLFKRKEARPP